MGRIFAGIIAIVGWFGLVLQLIITLTSPDNQTIPSAELIARYFSFFTVLTNLIVTITATAIAFLPDSRLGAFAARPSVQAAVATYISIVGIVYSLFLRAIWSPEGWQAVADHTLHDAIPLAFVLYWIVFAPKSGITWFAPLKWLVYPFIYIAYSLIRGAIVGWYPYWFVDVTQLGYPTALTNTAFVVVAFAVIGLVFAAVSNLFSK